MAFFYKLLLKFLGWKPLLTVDLPKKCVICVAPHTSNMDFFIGKIYYSSIGGKPHFLMKKEWFFFPFGIVLKAIGGIPVNRSKHGSLTEQMTTLFNQTDKFQLAISPEGTRQKNTNWKTGFYYIALKTGVPIALAHIDYRVKEVGITRIFYPTGNEQEDISEIKEFYKNFKGKFPENFGI